MTRHLAETLAQAISLNGPLSVARYMAAANAHYYATRDPLGTGGDFTTAPEISQVFGEIIGVWLADLWTRAGQPPAHYVELGPGRGSLAIDALRVLAGVGLKPEVHLVETSPLLRTQIAKRLPAAQFHDDIATLPDQGALLIVANEFFDALPIHQMIRGAGDWHERRVACQGSLFVPVAANRIPGELIPEGLRAAAPGAIIESSPASVAVVGALSRRLVAQGGAALIIDYGYEGPALGDTLQAVKGHRYANPFDAPGEQDLSAHVDFATLAAAALHQGARVAGPAGQGQFLTSLGVGERAAALIKAQPTRAAEIATAVERLIGAEAMGRLFRAMALHAPGWPAPAGL